MSTKQTLDVFNSMDNRIAFAVNESMSLNQAKALLKSRTGLNDTHIEVIGRKDASAEAKIEKNPSKLGRFMLNVHIKYSIIGLLIGMLTATGLIALEFDFTRENIVFTYIAFISPGIFIGAFVAGLISLNPTRDATNIELVQRSQDSKASLVVTCQSKEQKQNIQQAVNDISGLTAL